MTHITKITNIEGALCDTAPYKLFDTRRGLIYIQKCNLSSNQPFKGFQEGIKADYDEIESVTSATFIKTRNSDNQPIILTFNTPNLPYSIYIPGELQDPFVQPFISKPMLCMTGQTYGHTKKNCKSVKDICRRRAQEEHNMEECDADTPKCHHCKQPHQAGSKDCPRHTKDSNTRLVDKKVSFQRARQLATGWQCSVAC